MPKRPSRKKGGGKSGNGKSPSKSGASPKRGGKSLGGGKSLKPGKSKSRAQIERERAAQARARYEQEKKRIASSRASWQRRYSDPEKLVTYVENALAKFRRTHAKADYSRFRSWKRRLYAVAPSDAQDYLEEAAEASGWNEQVAAKFARLS